jgi:hypothetical protein
MQSELRLDFEWSFRPFLTVMRCIGIPLNHQTLPQEQEKGYCLLWHRCRYWVIVGFALLAFFLNIVSQLSAFSFGWIFFTSVLGKNYITTTVYVTQLINMASNVTITVGGHLMALAFTLPNWPRLTKILNQMEGKMFYSADFKRFRSVCKTGLLALMIVSTITIERRIKAKPIYSFQDVVVMMLIMVITPLGPSLIHWLLNISMFLCPIYILSHGHLFYSLSRVSYCMLTSLAGQVQKEAERQNTSSRTANTNQWWSRQVSKWKEQYNSITEFIDEINNCFGHLLLLAIPCCFVRMINNSFHLLSILLG